MEGRLVMWLLPSMCCAGIVVTWAWRWLCLLCNLGAALADVESINSLCCVHHPGRQRSWQLGDRPWLCGRSHQPACDLRFFESDFPVFCSFVCLCSQSWVWGLLVVFLSRMMWAKRNRDGAPKPCKGPGTRNTSSKSLCNAVANGGPSAHSTSGSSAGWEQAPAGTSTADSWRGQSGVRVAFAYGIDLVFIQQMNEYKSWHLDLMHAFMYMCLHV